MKKENNFTESFGALPRRIDVRDYKLRKSTLTNESFPEEFILDHPGIKNQGAVGSCVAHAISEVVEFFNCLQEGTEIEMSTGFIYGNRRNSLNKKMGMYIREALHNVCKYGDVYKSDFKENVEVPEAIEVFESKFDSLKEKALPNRFSSYFRLTSAVDIKRALMNYGPVVFALTWREGIYVDTNGILQINPKAKKDSGHCMLIYGWNKDGWLIQNSWGKYWGNKGCAILPYNAKLDEAWGVTDEIVDGKGDVKKPYNTTFLRWIAKVFNWICNLFRRKK